jgi:tRNA 2-selenouridine synthase
MIPIGINDFLQMRKELHPVDVRSEAEFQEGHVPGAVNIPLLNNEERVQVGTDYKQKGKDQAIRTGFRLVGPRLGALMDQVVSFSKGKELLVYCWRGGMRSENFCNFSAMAGVKTRRLTGGYKAYREMVQEIFNQKLPLIVIGGKTGSGKSDILRALENSGEQVIDLEKLANHKGSAFGGLLQPPQPSNEQFTNNLFEKILSLDLSRPIWVEDESISIGKIFLPKNFFEQKKNAPVVQIEVDKNIRVDRLVNEYGSAPQDEFLASMEKITKKLGGQNFNMARDFLMNGDMHGTISILLTYYDKTYTFSLENKSASIISVCNWDGRDSEQLISELKIVAEKYRIKN